LVVTGFYITEENGEKTENHLQLLLDRVENGHYILQSSLQRDDLPEMTHLIKIPLNRPYYVDHDHFVRNNFTHGNSYQYRDPSTGVSMKLVNFRVNCGLMTNTWYLFPTAYSIQFVKNEAIASPNFNLDDENLKKSSAMAELKERMTKIVNLDFQNLTNNVLDEKDSALCVPISVSVLLRWAIKNDLKVDESTMEQYFTVENILSKLTMMIYPRSLSGMNLNLKKEETEFQHNNIELLLKRMKNETFLQKNGLDVKIYGEAKASFDFNKGKNKQFLATQFKHF